MEKVCAVGLDIGTSTICAVVMDGKSGELLETVTRQNNSNMESENGWEKTQDPGIIMGHVDGILSELLKKYAPVACIGLSGQMHGILYVDIDGNAVSPLVTWQDGRGNLGYRDGSSYADYLSRVSDYKLATGFGAVTHFYNSVNGFVPSSAKSFCTIHDYAAMKLVKASRPLLHSTNAASLGFYNLEKNTFDRQAVRAAGIDGAFFPEVTPLTGIIGTTASKIPVAVAIGDNQASFMGSVNNNEECLAVNIGTSGQISLFIDHAVRNSQIDVRPFTRDGYLMVGASLCGGSSYALLENFFRSVVQMATGAEPPVMYGIMNKMAADFLSLENKLEVSTKFSGTRDNPGQRGGIANLGVDNFTPRHFTVGVLEGVASELYALYETMVPVLSRKPKKLIGSGNAIRLCEPLQRVVSDIFAMPMNIPLYKEEAACGAALFALVATGYFKSLPEAQSLIQYELAEDK